MSTEIKAVVNRSPVKRALVTGARAAGLCAAAFTAAIVCLRAQQPADYGTLRVLLKEDADVVSVKAQAAGWVTDLDSGVKHSLIAGETYLVRPSGAGIRFGMWDLGARVRYAPQQAAGLAALDGKRYRGSLAVVRADATLRVINELGVEEYLYSVLGKEMSPDWPMEALKAQAVISRTFALKNLGRKESGYDLASDTRSQVYGGVDTESPRAIRAVEETKGQVLTYLGQLVETHFHSCCGGHTSAVSTAWRDTRWEKPLEGVRDGFCAGTPYYKWKKAVPASELLNILPALAKPYKKIKKVSVSRRDASGYVRVLSFTTNAGSVKVRASDLRDRLGTDVLRSTYLTKIAVKKDMVQFSGRGWGHGVGLCQWGAKVQAQKGRAYKNILKFYYPGTKVVTWQD